MFKGVRILAILIMVALILPLIFSSFTANQAEAGCDANTVYVDASRPDDSGNGLSWATAKKYIQSGITIACHGGTVYVAAGVYDQPADSNQWEVVHLDDDLTIIGASALTTFIDGKDSYRGISITSHPGQVNTIRGFTIRNGRTPVYAARLIPAFTSYAAGIGISFPDIRPRLFNGPQLSSEGGGIWITDQHIVTIEDCAIINNRGRNGGGIYNAGQLTLDRCTVANNDAYDEGGGIYMNWSGPPAATLEVINCTISGNTAAGTYGGGIYCGTQMFLLNSTIAGNSVTGTASKGGGFANTGTAAFKNCIVANNIADEPTNNNGAYWSGGTVISQGYNIDGQNSCGFNQPTDQINTNPHLAALHNNGGPTSTCAITSDSPAYNRGAISGSPMTDQRGIARPQAGAIDIGAFELVPATPSPTPNPLLQELLENESETPSGSSGGAKGTYGYGPPVGLPTIVVQGASISARAVTPGSPVTVTADIANKSAVNGNKKVTLYVNGQVDTTQAVSVSSGGHSKLTFNVSRSEPGDYLVYVDGVPAGSFKVELFRESDIILVISTTLVATAFLLGMVMLWRRQRTGYK